MTWTDKQLNDAEEAVVKFSEASGLSHKEVVNIIADGLDVKYNGKLPDVIYDLIDELRATFDAY